MCRMRLERRAWATLVMLALVTLGTEAPATPMQYVIEVPSRTPEHVGVNAEFDVDGDTIGMYIVSSPQLTNGSADLVDDLRVHDESGVAVALTALGGGDWRLERPVRRARVSYSVRLTHNDYSWGPGIDEVAYTTADGVFFAGPALFVLPLGDSEETARLRFDLPDGWIASLPWDVADGWAQVPDRTSLVRNCFMLGEHHEETIALGDFSVTLAIAQKFLPQRDLFIRSFAPILPAARDVFGGMPRKSRYLVVINPGSRTDGGAYLGSYSMLILGEVDEGTSVAWGHGIAHETLHFWNGISLTAASTESEWFKEGGTDYLTMCLRSRLGLDSREVLFRKLENTFRRVTLVRALMQEDRSIAAAGEDKHRLRFLVYGGGTLAFLALDTRIREATNDEMEISDLLRAMYAEFALEGRSYTNADVARLAGRIANEDMTSFFSQYVEGPALPDFAPLLQSLGLRLVNFADEFYVQESTTATAEQRARRASIFGVSSLPSR